MDNVLEKETDEEEKKRKYQRYMENRTQAELEEYFNVHIPKEDL